MTRLYQDLLESATGHLEDGLYKDFCIESLKLQHRLFTLKRLHRQVRRGLIRHKEYIFNKLLRMRAVIPCKKRNEINKQLLDWDSKFLQRYKNVMGNLEERLNLIRCKSSFYNDLRNTMTGQRQRQNKSFVRVAAFRFPKKYEYIAEIKKIGCADCNSLNNLTFDHLPGSDKKFDIASAMHKSLEDIKNEIAKCEVVCRDCHDARERDRGVM